MSDHYLTKREAREIRKKEKKERKLDKKINKYEDKIDQIEDQLDQIYPPKDVKENHYEKEHHYEKENHHEKEIKKEKKYKDRFSSSSLGEPPPGYSSFFETTESSEVEHTRPVGLITVSETATTTTSEN